MADQIVILGDDGTKKTTGLIGAFFSPDFKVTKYYKQDGVTETTSDDPLGAPYIELAANLPTLPTPTFAAPVVTSSTIEQSVTNLPSGAAVVWTVGGIVDPNYTGATFSLDQLDPSTAYDITAKFTKAGNNDSAVASTTVTTSAAGDPNNKLGNFRDTYPFAAGATPPLNATNHIITFASGVTIVAPSLKFDAAGGEVICQMDAGVLMQFIYSNDESSSNADQLITIDTGTGHLLVNNDPNYFQDKGALAPGAFVGFSRTTPTTYEVIKYEGDTRTVLDTYTARSGVNYIKFKDVGGKTIKYLQYNNLVTVV